MDNVKTIQEILNKKPLEEELDLEEFDLTEEELECIDDMGEIYGLD